MESGPPPCLTCECTDRRVTLTPHLPHHGKEVCDNCGRFIRWLPKPDADKAARPSAHRKLVQKYSAGYCEICLIAEDNLPPRQTLEGHHIVEYQDGGGDSRENVQIACTKCHKLIHWVRNHTTPKD